MVSKLLENMSKSWHAKRELKAYFNNLYEFNTSEALGKYLVVLRKHGRKVPFDNWAFNLVVFRMGKWELEAELLEWLFASIENEFLPNCVPAESENYVQGWLKQCRLTKRLLDISAPPLAEVLPALRTKGLLKELPAEDRQYLISQYKAHYELCLQEWTGGNPVELLDMLMRYGSILHETPSDAMSQKTLTRLRCCTHARPRSVSSVSDEEATSMPLLGVGSPHRTAVTVYHDSLSGQPVRLCGAGLTADETLNERTLTSLFAAALSCDGEPTLVTTQGWSLTTQPAPMSKTSSHHPLVSAVITPEGPGEPRSGIASVGLSPSDALSVSLDYLNRCERENGLVSVEHWDQQDVQEFEDKIRNALAQTLTGERVVKSPETNADVGAVIHVMPYYLRTAKEGVAPMEIRMAYSALGTTSLFQLLREARSSYMNQLIYAAQRRAQFAAAAEQEQNRAIEHWQSLSEQKKDAMCESSPTVTIAQVYDWELGMAVPMAEPEQRPRRLYEDVDRPGIARSACEVKDKYTKLQTDLGEINAEGGKADILSFKLLFDAMLREAPPPVYGDRFAEGYKNWCEKCSPIVWQTIASWCTSRGIDPEMLAADNVCFNAFPTAQGEVVIRPMVLIDLHDYIIRIRGEKGTLEVLTAGNSATLEDRLSQRQLAPEAAHKKLRSWIDGHVQLPRSSENFFGSSEELMAKHPAFWTFTNLQIAKLCLDAGQVDTAIRTLKSIQAKDYAPTYFWLAVAHHCKSCMTPLSNMRLIRPGGAQGEDIPLEASDVVRTIATESILVQWRETGLPNSKASIQPMGRPGRQSENEALIRQMPTMTKSARDALDQCYARSQTFVESLVENTYSDFSKLEAAEFSLSENDLPRISAFVRGVAAVELLRFAEGTRGLAEQLSYGTSKVSEVKNKLTSCLTDLHPLLRNGKYRSVEELNQLSKTMLWSANEN